MIIRLEKSHQVKIAEHTGHRVRTDKGAHKRSALNIYEKKAATS